MAIKKVVIDKANRLYQLAPELAASISGSRAGSFLRRTELLDLATFTWPAEISDKSIDASRLVSASKEQIDGLRGEISEWMASRVGVQLNPKKEILVGGSISSLMHTFALAFIDSGDVAFVPELGLPLYRRVISACGGEPVSYSNSGRNGWRPDFGRVSSPLGRVARAVFINTPHNPTGFELNAKDLADLVWIAGRENLMIVNDAAYASISGGEPVSLLSIPGGKKTGVEVCSFSYNLGLPSLPFGFAAGNREIIAGMEEASSLSKPFIPLYWVELAREAIRNYPAQVLVSIRQQIATAQAEAELLISELGYESETRHSVPFLWARIARRSNSQAAATLLSRVRRIQVMPGSAFGETGEGYLRFSLTASADDYAEARTRAKRRGLTGRRKKGRE